MTEKRGLSFRELAMARGLALLMARAPKRLVEYPDANAIDLENRAMAAIKQGKSELFPLEKRKPPAFQLRFPGF